jgi:hypothetical protein
MAGKGMPNDLWSLARTAESQIHLSRGVACSAKKKVGVLKKWHNIIAYI